MRSGEWSERVLMGETDRCAIALRFTQTSQGSFRRRRHLAGAPFHHRDAPPLCL
jgi:hypothetical protein